MPNKSKLGCLTCRTRKVKCDETTPVCRRCSTTGRRCEGPFRSKFVFVDPSEHYEASKWERSHGQEPPKTLSDPQFDPLEARTLQYFLQKAAPAVSRGLDEEFWTTFLPRLGHSNSAIKYAILTISHLYEHPCIRTWKQSTLDESPRNPAFGWYARSLSAFRSYLAELAGLVDYQLALLSCILFTNIEFQQNNAANACRLLQCGHSLIEGANTEGKRKLGRSDPATKTILEMFSRQRVLMALFGYDPPEYANEASASGHDAAWSSLDASQESLRADLFRCVKDTVSLARAARANELSGLQRGEDESLHAQRQRALEALELWHHNFSQYTGIKQAQSSEWLDSLSMVLLIYYEMALIWIMTCLDSEESATDRYMDQFGRILDLVDRITLERQKPNALSAHYSPELGTVAPLFMVGWKCRDRNLRRRALDLLRQGPEHEALYRADIHASALRKVIEIEEESATMSMTHGEVPQDWIPPEAARIRNLTVQWELWDGVKVQPCLIYDTSTHHAEFPATLVQKKVLL